MPGWHRVNILTNGADILDWLSGEETGEANWTV